MVRAIVGSLFLVALLLFPLDIFFQVLGLPIHTDATRFLSGPVAPDLLWFRAVDCLSIASVAWWIVDRLRRRLATEELALKRSDAALAVAGIVAIALVSPLAAAIATFPISVLLRGALAPRAELRNERRWGPWLAGAWAVALIGCLIAVNAVPVAAQPGAACGPLGGGPGLVNTTTGTYGTDQGPLRFPFSAGKVAVPALCTMNRAWFASATVLGVDQSRLASDAPWQVSLGDLNFNLTPTKPNSVFTRATSPFTLAPRQTKDVTVLVRFTSCSRSMSGRTFTLPSIPLLVRAYGRTQTDSVSFAQPVQTTCP
jgi:hypothetical protein